MASSISQKARENRLRRMAKRQGLEVRKSRTRDPRALDYGRWEVVDLVYTKPSERRDCTAANTDQLEEFLERGFVL